jgi:phage baseplate assembly protein W
MNGTNASTGKLLTGLDHLRQSIADILTTPIGTRVMRRDYGSRLYELVDAPMNGKTITDIYAATAEALQTWEPRIQVTQVLLTSAGAGQLSIDVAGIYKPNGQAVKIDGIRVS